MTNTERGKRHAPAHGVPNSSAIVELSFKTNSSSTPSSCAWRQTRLAFPCVFPACVHNDAPIDQLHIREGTRLHQVATSYPSQFVHSDFTQQNHLSMPSSECVPSVSNMCLRLPPLRGLIEVHCWPHTAALRGNQESTPWLLGASQKSRIRPQEEMASQGQIGKWHSNILGTLVREELLALDGEVTQPTGSPESRAAQLD